MKRQDRKAELRRCAIYTRVSTEYGLEQEFNSHDGASYNTAVNATVRRNDNFHQFQARWRDVLLSTAEMIKFT